MNDKESISEVNISRRGFSVWSSATQRLNNVKIENCVVLCGHWWL